MTQTGEIYDSIEHAQLLIRNYGRCRPGKGKPDDCKACFLVAELKVMENGALCMADFAYQYAQFYLRQIREGTLTINKCKSIW